MLVGHQAQRAALGIELQIREQTSVCKLYMCIAVLVVILVLLLIIGFS
jgi:hypothetical protein